MLDSIDPASPEQFNNEPVQIFRTRADDDLLNIHRDAPIFSEVLPYRKAEPRGALIFRSLEDLFPEVEKLTLSPFFARLARCGVEIYLKKIGVNAEVGKRFRLFDDDGFFALGEVREFEDGLAVKPIKQFDI